MKITYAERMGFMGLVKSSVGLLMSSQDFVFYLAPNGKTELSIGQYHCLQLEILINCLCEKPVKCGSMK